MIILSAAVAAPVFAQETNVLHARAYHNRNFHGAYNHLNAPIYANPQMGEGRNIEDFGFSGRDRSYPGGEDPSLNPAAN